MMISNKVLSAVLLGLWILAFLIVDWEIGKMLEKPIFMAIPSSLRINNPLQAAIFVISVVCFIHIVSTCLVKLSVLKSWQHAMGMAIVSVISFGIIVASMISLRVYAILPDTDRSIDLSECSLAAFLIALVSNATYDIVYIYHCRSGKDREKMAG